MSASRTVKAEAEAEATSGRAMSGLLLTYPVHQAADILFRHANLVPVGKDQLPHVETARLVARRFNERYGGGATVFDEPDALLTAAPLLLGLDGAKMSKSRGNAVELGASEDDTARVVHSAKTDTQRTITYDPDGRPEVANLVLLAALCTGADPAELAESIGDRGASALKAVVVEAINERPLPPTAGAAPTWPRTPTASTRCSPGETLVPTRSQTRPSIASLKRWGWRTYMVSRGSVSGRAWSGQGRSGCDAVST